MNCGTPPIQQQNIPLTQLCADFIIIVTLKKDQTPIHNDRLWFIALTYNCVYAALHIWYWPAPFFSNVLKSLNYKSTKFFMWLHSEKKAEVYHQSFCQKTAIRLPLWRIKTLENHHNTSPSEAGEENLRSLLMKAFRQSSLQGARSKISSQERLVQE